MSRFGMVGGHSGQLLSLAGKVIVHDNRAELEYLFPNVRVVKLTNGSLGQPTMRLRDHPDCKHIRFPLRREDFQ